MSFDCIFENISLYLTLSLRKVHLEKHISILEHTFFEWYQYKLTLWESLTDHVSDILSMRQIQSRIDLIQYIKRRRFVQKQRQDEAQG